MTRNDLFESIIADLGANYQEDDEKLLGALLDEAISDALIISNRSRLAALSKEGMAEQISILSSNIRKAVVSTYLARGSEDVESQTVSGLSSTFENAIDTMSKDIIKQGKRILK